ncbi:MAG: SufD family Fe-S cluster assembly protein [Candidatus Nanohaloarchaea archaeon]
MKLEELNSHSQNLESLEMPESIRTPGRTWTRYPEEITELEDVEEVEPRVETEGDVDVYTGDEAVERAGEKLFDLISPDENRLTALHSSKLNSLVYVKASGASEVHVKYSEEGAVLSHLVVEAEKNSDVVVTEETENEGFNSSFTEIYIEENASVEYGAVEKPGDFSYSRRKAISEKYGSIKWLNGIFAGNLNRTKIESVLKGNNSETEMTGVWYPTDKQHHDISLQAKHIGDNTKCDMDSRSVVDHKARSLYEGLQKVEEDALETSSFQDQETLMLSEGAESDASPKLMIEDPNVEASHAAAAGTVEEDKQHYLESRGMDEEQAERLVVQGFFEPVMSEIKVPRIKKRIRREVQRKLDSK